MITGLFVDVFFFLSLVVFLQGVLSAFAVFGCLEFERVFEVGGYKFDYGFSQENPFYLSVDKVTKKKKSKK